MRRDAFELYKELVCDFSASNNLSQEEIDQCVHIMFDLEDASIVYDLRSHYAEKAKFDQFWPCTKEYTEKKVGKTVDDQQHSTVVHIAKAISIRDLCEKVVERCPPNPPILVMNGFTYSYPLLANHMHNYDTKAI